MHLYIIYTILKDSVSLHFLHLLYLIVSDALSSGYGVRTTLTLCSSVELLFTFKETSDLRSPDIFSGHLSLPAMELDD